MQSVHLISLQYEGPTPKWKLGEVWIAKPNIYGLDLIVQDCVCTHPSDWLLILDSSFDLPNFQKIQELTQQPIDLWHAGLRLGVVGLPGLIDFVAPTWTFNRDPDPGIEATSWRVSLQACLVRAEVIRQLGFLYTGFTSLEAAALEWGHRCIQHGALMRYHPGLLPVGFQALPDLELPFADQMRFIQLRYGRKWAAWALLRSLLSGYVPAKAAFSTWRQLQREKHAPKPRPYQSPASQTAGSIHIPNKENRVSVLVPTLERYPCLRTLLRQLGEQSYPPEEILVVDQTPVEQRTPELYQEFERLPLRVLYQEQSGQCSSRNLGLGKAKGDYILFLDDDDEIPPDLLEKHLQNLAGSQADASCGAADEVGAGPLPHAFTYRRASDVFPTNNTLLRKSALLKSGLFDLAYEHGARADGDLGMRLYLGGAKMIYEPGIRVLHHHAPRGGLRAHKARQVTYASSRSNLFTRHLPSVTELYLVRRYFSPRQAREHLWMSVLGTFSLHKSSYQRWLKVIISAFLLPHSLYLISKRVKSAKTMFQKYPQIPHLHKEDREA